MSDDLAAVLARKKAALLAAAAALDDSEDDESQVAETTVHSEDSSNDLTADSSSPELTLTPSVPANKDVLSKRQQRRLRTKSTKQLIKETSKVWEAQTAARLREIINREDSDTEDEAENESSNAPEKTHPSSSVNADLPSEESDEDEFSTEISNKERKKLIRPSIAELKASSARPDLVEAHDCNSHEPHLLVFLKALPGIVPVPPHWSQKRRFLDNKKAFDKPAFQLPAFIEATGVAAMRSTAGEDASSSTLRKEMRERTRPKLNKMDVDPQVLEDAFFVHQTRPVLTAHGEMYREGKEFEDRFRNIRPGKLSPELLRALAVETGPTGAPLNPLPWIPAMQALGPPPAYPSLRIPGVNAPLPEGARWGYGPGEWGRPPVDELGVPLWGDIFGVETPGGGIFGRAVLFRRERDAWGKMQQLEEEDQPEDDDIVIYDEEEEGEGEKTEQAGTETGVRAGEEEEEDDIQSGTAMPNVPTQPKSLFTVVEQVAVGVGSEKMGTSYLYNMPSSIQVGAGAGNIYTQKPPVGVTPTTSTSSIATLAANSGGIDLSLRPEELENLDKEMLRRKFEEAMASSKDQDGEDDRREWEQSKKKRRVI